MFLFLTSKRYYILKKDIRGQIYLIDGPFLSLRRAHKIMCGQQWVELLTSK